MSNPRQAPIISPISMADEARLDVDLKSYSCLTCRQRKIKCDRHNPCSACVKFERQCSFVAPVRAKRAKTKASKEGIHARLRRYEELLQSYGATIEPFVDDADSVVDTSPQHDKEMTGDFDADDLPGSGVAACAIKGQRLNPKYMEKYDFTRIAHMPMVTNYYQFNSDELWRNGELECLLPLNNYNLISYSFLTQWTTRITTLQKMLTLTSQTSSLGLRHVMPPSPTIMLACIFRVRSYRSCGISTLTEWILF